MSTPPHPRRSSTSPTPADRHSTPTTPSSAPADPCANIGLAPCRRTRRGPYARAERSPEENTMSQQPYPAQPYTGTPAGLSPKSWLATLLLSIFLGELGIDRFYLGKIGTGILKLITVGGFGLWWLIDLILVIAVSMKDKQGLPVKYVPAR